MVLARGRLASFEQYKLNTLLTTARTRQQLSYSTRTTR
jgi:hypothetical protein